MKLTGAVLDSTSTDRRYAQSKPLSIREVELDAPGPDEVLVKTLAAGLCHSDLSVVDGNRPRPVPMLLGHEGCGVIEAVGESVDGLEVGPRVVTVFLPRWGECDHCLTDGKLPCIPGTEYNNKGVLFGDQQRLHMADASGDIHHHLGGVGVAALITALSLELGDVYGVDAHPEKLRLAKRLGAKDASTPQEVEKRA